MTVRIDTFRADGVREAAFYTNSAGKYIFDILVERLRSGRLKSDAEMLDEAPITTVVMGPSDKEPWF